MKIIPAAARDLSIFDTASRPAIECRAGHANHETIHIEVNLDGPTRVPDYPSIPPRLRRRFGMTAYNRAPYLGFPNYCTGQDEISFSLESHGIWEGFETLVVLDILERGDRNRIVLDFGSHIGWYSLLAASFGYRVVAFEADAENVRTLRANAQANGFQDLITVVHTWVDERFPDLPADDEVEFMKCDIEGKEGQAVRACGALFQGRKIRHALIEISPVFSSPGYEVLGVVANSYTDLSRRIAELGYVIADIPSKGFPGIRDLENDPLGTLHKLAIRPDQVADYLAGVDQTNFLFSAQ